MELKIGFEIFVIQLKCNLKVKITQTQTAGDSLQAADDTEFSKLIKEVLCSSKQGERCEEHESELASARETYKAIQEIGK